jgi:hypothetical protein
MSQGVPSWRKRRGHHKDESGTGGEGMTAKEIVERIYRAYGTDSGFLFGLPPEYKDAVETIVRVALNMDKEKS